MKKILLTFATLMSSHLFAAGNPEALRGRFQVNTSRCKGFLQNTPSRAFVSTQSNNSLTVEFIGSEGKQFLIRTENGDDMGRNGRETFTAVWNGDKILTSTRNLIKDNGRKSQEVSVIQNLNNGLLIEVTVDGREVLDCELSRNR